MLIDNASGRETPRISTWTGKNASRAVAMMEPPAAAFTVLTVEMTVTAGIVLAVMGSALQIPAHCLKVQRTTTAGAMPEVYGTKSVKQNQIKPNSTFFDALGKAYRKIKSQIKCFVRKSDIEKTERVYAVEFEVYKKIIADDEGNDIEIFRKEDDKNGLRRDSTAFFG